MNWFRELFFRVKFGARSSSWPAFRRVYIKSHCEGCGTTKRRELHHIVPFTNDRTLELEPSNVITLCRDCHYFIGHLKSWRSFNPEVVKDAGIWLEKITNRP